MTLNREQMLIEMGIRPLWAWRESCPVQPEAALEAVSDPPDAPVPASASAAAAATAPAVPSVSSPPIETLSWSDLPPAVQACRACGLHQRRQHAVAGMGDAQAEWLFISDAPGHEEDARGEPFAGVAGELFDAMLAALDLGREHQVFVTLAVKCRTPDNRPPEGAEIAACRPWLQRQIALLQPKIIVALGKSAALSLLGRSEKLADLRGQALEYEGIPVVVSYHPSYLLRNLPDKAKTWEDLLRARQLWRAGVLRKPAQL